MTTIGKWILALRTQCKRIQRTAERILFGWDICDTAWLFDLELWKLRPTSRASTSKMSAQICSMVLLGGLHSSKLPAVDGRSITNLVRILASLRKRIVQSLETRSVSGYTRSGSPDIPRSCSLPSNRTPRSCPALRWSHEDCRSRMPLGRGTSDRHDREWFQAP